jgi:hypothetical protein
MTAEDLTCEQADPIGARIREAMDYVGSLRERMDATGWNPNDRLYHETHRAHVALPKLNVSLHYRSCGMNLTVRNAPRYIVADENPRAARVV